MFSGPLLHIAGLVSGERGQSGLLETAGGLLVLLVHGVGPRLTGRLLALHLKLVLVIVTALCLPFTSLPPLHTKALSVSAVLPPEIFYILTKYFIFEAANVTSWPPCLCGLD